MKDTVRSATFSPGSGQDVKDTKQVSGQAVRTAAEAAKNKTVPHTVSNPGFGKLGGRASQ